MKLFCFPRSGNSREVKIVLAEKGLNYEMINIHANKEVVESPEFKKASPKGTVPAMIDGDVYLSEALLINQYLDEKYPIPALLPKDASEKKKVIDFILLLDRILVKNIGALVIECILKPKTEQREDFKEKKRKEVLEVLKELDKKLEGRDYLCGDYTIADAAITPHVAALPILGMTIPAELKNLSAWFKRIQERPSFKQSLQ